MTVLPPCQLELDIQLFLVVYVEAFLAHVCNKIKYHPAFFVITTELGVSLNVVFKEHLNIYSIRIVNGLLQELFSFLFVWKVSCLFVSYDKFLAMWLVSEFFRFSKVASVSTFFSSRLLLSNCYYCVIWCISGEKSLFVRKKSTSGKPA